ncbi:MAG: hypothetical protein MK006_12795 [Pirellulales bacterium]|nr:hypothetical protein [Pirellulales bacterium]
MSELKGNSVCHRHMVFGWWSLAVFMSLGVVLECLHALEVSEYLANETRRMMWRLAHAHGTLLGLLNIAFALSADRVQQGRFKLASRLLLVGTVLLPGGFFAGGVTTYDSDPGPGVWLVPIGAIAALAAVVITAFVTGKNSSD